MINTEVAIFLHTSKIRYAYSPFNDITYGLHFNVYNTIVSKLDYQDALYQSSKFMVYFRFSTP